MAQIIAERGDIDFVLYEQFQADELTRHPRYNSFNKKTFDLIVNEARNLAIQEILPRETAKAPDMKTGRSRFRPAIIVPTG